MSTFFRKLEDDGYVRFEGHLIGSNTFSIARNLGTIARIPEASIVQTLIPSSKDSREASSYSGNYGTGEFPFHSDMAHWFRPPKYLLLRCIIPSPLVETRITKAAPLFEGEDIYDLRRALFRPRKRLDGRLSPLRLFEGDLYRWDSLFIEPMNKLAASLRTRVAERFSSVGYKAIALDRTDDCILIDNWHAFHSRSAVPPEALNRRLERIYLSELKE